MLQTEYKPKVTRQLEALEYLRETYGELVLVGFEFLAVDIDGVLRGLPSLRYDEVYDFIVTEASMPVPEVFYVVRAHQDRSLTGVRARSGERGWSVLVPPKSTIYLRGLWRIQYEDYVCEMPFEIDSTAADEPQAGFFLQKSSFLGDFTAAPLKSSKRKHKARVHGITEALRIFGDPINA